MNSHRMNVERTTGRSEEPRPAELFALSVDLCRSLLGTQVVGRLVLAGPEPYVAPVNFAMVDGGIIFRSEPGPRLDRIQGNRVAFEVDDHDDRTQSGWSVVVRGTAYEITLDVAAEVGDARWGTVQPWAPGPKACWIRIEVESVTGRFLRGAVLPSWVHDEAYL